MIHRPDHAWHQEHMARMRAVDERACHNAIERVMHAVQEWIVLKHKGSMPLKEQLTRDVKQMARAMQAGLVSDGREGFMKECKHWTGHVLFDDFMMRLDMTLTKMPASRSKRRDAVGLPPRGTGVYFPKD
jgi:hypothetical protein